MFEGVSTIPIPVHPPLYSFARYLVSQFPTDGSIALAIIATKKLINTQNFHNGSPHFPSHPPVFRLPRQTNGL